MNKKKIEKLIDGLTLFDDDLMSKVFEKDLKATELLLQIILKRKDITVTQAEGQYTMKNPYVKGRSITLDIHALDKKKREFDVEVQQAPAGSVPQRARFHSSMMDTRMLKEKQEFKELRDSYVIFICKHDRFMKGWPIYHVDRIVNETGKHFSDGSHIIYVNGNYAGDDDIGKLIQDFNCKRSEDMHYTLLAEGVHHFKETQEGRETMCEAVEKFVREEVLLETRELKQTIKSKEEALKSKDEAIKSKDQALKSKDEVIKSKDQEIARLRAALEKQSN